MTLRSAAARTAAALLACAVVAAPVPAFAAPGTAGSAAPLTTARAGHVAAGLPDGRVLVVGGDPDATSTVTPGTAEIYDPGTGSWTATAPYAAERRVGHTVTTLADGRVLVAGGRWASGGYGGTWSDAVYDPAADTWTPVAAGSSGERQGWADALLPDGRVLLAGGTSGFVHEPATGARTATGPLKASHPNGDAVTLPDGTVLLDGGSSTIPVERWSPVTNAWTAVPMPPGWSGQYLSLATRLVRVPGGALLVANDGRTLVFSAASGGWRAGGSMRSSRTRHGLVALETGEVFVAGGGTRTELYDPATDLWRDGPVLAERFDPALAPVGDGDVLLVAGTTDRRAVDRYTPPAAAAPPAATTEPAVLLETHLPGYQGRAGAPAGVVAHLRGAASQEPVAGEPVRLYARGDTATEWTLVGETATDAHGAANFDVRPTERTTYAARHPGTPAAAPAAALELRFGVTPSPVPPGRPERVLAEPGNGAVHVSWLPPADDGGSPVTSYEVRARPTWDYTSQGTAVTVGGSAREATVSGLTNGTQYHVSVLPASAEGTGTGTSSNAVTPSATAPPRPAPPAGGTRVCGRLPLGTTRWGAAGSPYHVCPLGLIVATGSTLVVDGAELRFAGPTPFGGAQRSSLAIVGGGVRVTGSVLRGDDAQPGEWGGIALDQYVAGVTAYGVNRTSSTLSLAGSEVRHATDAVHAEKHATWLRLDDTLLADAKGHGLRAAEMPVRAANLTVRGVGGAGVDVTCRPATSAPDAPCPVTLDGVTVDRAGGRGLRVAARGPVVVRAPLVTATGTTAPISEAARFTGMTAAYGAGGDIEEVRGGGNGIDAVLLDLTLTRDLVWRSPAAGSAATPLPLGFLAGGVRMAAGRSVTFPAGSVVKGIPTQYDDDCTSPYYYLSKPCHASIDVVDGTLDASAPGSVFTSVGDPSVGVTTCPSALVAKCGADSWGWRGLAAHGTRARVSLAGATVRFARSGLMLAGDESPGGPGLVASVTGTSFSDVHDGIVANGPAWPAEPLGSLAVDGVTLDRAGATALRASGSRTITLNAVTVRTASTGVTISGRGGQEGCTPRSVIRITGLEISDAKRTGLDLFDVCHPQVRGVTVRRSALPVPDATYRTAAVEVNGTYSVGTGRDLDGFTGGGNGVDAVSLDGNVTEDLAWVSPANAPADHPLGYVIGGRGGQLGYDGHGGLALRGRTLTVPAGSLVASLNGGDLALHGAHLDASAGGARFVSATDPLAAELDCRTGCGTRHWDGVLGDGLSDTAPAGDVRLVRATFRGGRLQWRSPADRADGLVSVVDSTFDTLVAIARPNRAVVIGSRMPALHVGEALHADVRRNTLTGTSAPGVLLSGRGQAAPSGLVLRDNVAASTVGAPAFRLLDAHVALGPAGTVDGNVGSGDNAVLLLTRVTTAADLRWVSPTAEPWPHPVGYVAGGDTGYGSVPALTVRGPRTLTLPAGAVMKLAGRLRLEGAYLDATAGGAVVTSTSDDSVGVATCASPYPVPYWYSYGCGDPESVPGYTGPTVEAVPDPATGNAGGVGLRGARVNGQVSVTGPAAGAPGFPGFGLAAASSYVLGQLKASGTPASVTRTRVVRHAGAGIDLAKSSGNVVRDVTVDGVASHGIRLDDARADVRETAITGSARTDGAAAVHLAGPAGGTFTCLDVRGNGNGFATAATAVTVTESTLRGNVTAGRTYGSYDLDNHGPVTTSGVWWGQAGGPVAGQVRDAAKHTDVAPRSAAPACAVAESAAPPSAPRSVAGTAEPSGLTAIWAAPASDGGSPVTEYRVTVSPGGATTVVPGTARRATVGGLTAGEPYVVRVTAVNAAGAGPASRVSAAVYPVEGEGAGETAGGTGTGAGETGGAVEGEGGAAPAPAPAPAPVATTLTTTAPSVVTYGTGALVTGRLARAGGGALAGEPVAVYVRRAGATTWGAPVATVTTSATGTVSHRLRLGGKSEIQLRYAGSADTLATIGPARTVQVRPVVPLNLSGYAVPRGTGAALSGRVSPLLAGHRVTLQRYTANGWQSVTSTTLSRTSAYRFVVRPSRRGSYRYRVVYSATARYARAVSPTRTLKVT